MENIRITDNFIERTIDRSFKANPLAGEPTYPTSKESPASKLSAMMDIAARQFIDHHYQELSFDFDQRALDDGMEKAYDDAYNEFFNPHFKIREKISCGN